MSKTPFNLKTSNTLYAHNELKCLLCFFIPKVFDDFFTWEEVVIIIILSSLKSASDIQMLFKVRKSNIMNPDQTVSKRAV